MGSRGSNECYTGIVFCAQRIVSQRAPMGDDAAAAHIQLKVKDQQGSEVQFKIKKSTPVRKLMDAYCSRLGLTASQVRFMVDGERISADDTAEKLGLEDEDLIDVAMEQTGGAAAMKKRVLAMSKGALADALATQCELKKTVCSKVLDSLTGVATTQLKKAGVFTIPGLCRLKLRQKPATKAGKREVFGKVVMVKAKPAKTIVKAFPVAALKASI